MSTRHRLVLFAFVGFLSACASTSNQRPQGGGEKDVHNLPQVTSFRSSDLEPASQSVPEFDNIPPEVEPHIQKWENYFTGRGREHMERYLARSTRYSGLMKKILRENGLPEDLIYIALIESGFSPKALSRASAVGYWQFIRGTGTRYGLEINQFVDERRDPVLATQAAADYLKGLYSVFDSWFLSMASYNVGENRVKREIMKNYTRDFWVLAKKRRLPSETINYVPKFLAARRIAKNPEKYGFTDVPYESPIEFETLALSHAINMRELAEKMDVDYAEMKRLNPRYRGEIATISRKGLEIRVPLGTVQLAKNLAESVRVNNLQFVADRGEMDVYRIRPGDTLSTIARRHRTTVAHLRELNNINKGFHIRAERTMFVPWTGMASVRAPSAQTSAQAKPAAKSQVQAQASDSNQGTIRHRVKAGENLFVIARKYGTSVGAIKKANNLGRKSVIRAGTKLVIPMENKQSSGRANKAVVHVVRAGDTLTGIASRYNTSLASIREHNNMSSGGRILVGERLRIPHSSVE